MTPPQNSRLYRTGLAVCGALLLLSALLLFWANKVSAETAVAAQSSPHPQISFSPAALPPAQDEGVPEIPVSDQACRLCHEDTTAVIELPSGETVHAQVDTAVLDASVHGTMSESPLACYDCHKPINDYQYPHEPTTAETLRAFEIEKSATCETCHVQPHLTSHPGPQSENPVICTDCHTGHDVQPVETWHEGQNTAACTDCHQANNVPVSTEMADAAIQGGLFAQEAVNNDYCLACHSQPDLTMQFVNGDEVSLTIDEAGLHDSVHGAGNEWQELQCTDCHTDYTYPHEPVTAVSYRQYQLNQNNLCQSCHEVEFSKALNSVHSEALVEGNLDAAMCTDCHSPHDMPVPDEPRERINETCQQCHSTIFDEYATSVHGEALIGEGNEDVPSCVNCHGVHDIQSPTTATFRVNSPHLCADCHADEELMSQYEVSTDVFETYVADFHGTTALLFESTGEENAELNEAVCYDCHGVHNIQSVDAPNAHIKENLLETCQQCHPDATENFPASWTSHYKPSLENYTLVYLVELFYSIVIPVTVGFFAFMVAVDVYGRIRRKRKQNNDQE